MCIGQSQATLFIFLQGLSRIWTHVFSVLLPKIMCRLKSKFTGMSINSFVFPKKVFILKKLLVIC